MLSYFYSILWKFKIKKNASFCHTSHLKCSKQYIPYWILLVEYKEYSTCLLFFEWFKDTLKACSQFFSKIMIFEQIVKKRICKIIWKKLFEKLFHFEHIEEKIDTLDTSKFQVTS